MNIVIETEAIADARGGVHLDLPAATVQPNARLLLKVEIDQKAGEQRPYSRRFATKDDYHQALNRMFGQSNDPTFVAPEDQSLQEIEPTSISPKC